MPVEFSFNALTDLEVIEDFITKQSGNPEIARDFIETLVEGLQILDTFPYAGTARDDLMMNMRQYNVKGYIALYEPTETGVIVKVITRKGRDLHGLFE